MQNAKQNKSQMLDVKCQIHILNVKSNQPKKVAKNRFKI